jgi:alkylation response protein AidB-like acyl-CoA dehydrogenase
MSAYIAPLPDMQFVLQELIGLDEIAELPGCEEVTPDLVDAILDEAGKFACDVLAPLNKPGDTQGCKFKDHVVTTPDGFKQAYRRFIDGGWTMLACDPDYGGQGLPAVVATPVEEMWHAANMGFALCQMLTQGAIEAIHLCGSDELKQHYLAKMVSGEWTGTMNLTEPQAGSDLSAVRTKAVPEGDHHRLFGSKIFITYGEHDYTENIIHLVLARTLDAPEGIKGLSLFVVPKYLVNADSSLGDRNDVYCVSIEHKLGIHASPTAVLAFGDNGGAVGYLVGEENRGLEYMFIMMNAARFSVGLQGVAIAERAYQHALTYAKARIQGAEAGVRGGGKVSIIRHPDVRRMLMSMKAQVEAMRALAYFTAASLDKATRHPDAAERARHQAFADLMIPVVKGWSTETSIDIASTGIQIQGGMGYVEETGAAQHLRDARITTIYEGTTGIQANDLIGRKIAREKGATAQGVIAMMKTTDGQLAEAPGTDFSAIRAALSEGVRALDEATGWIVATYSSDVKAASAGAVPFLELFGIVAGGWQMARAALAAQAKLSAGDDSNGSFYKAKISTARFYADHVLSQAPGLRHAVVGGAAGVLALDEGQF